MDKVPPISDLATLTALAKSLRKEQLEHLALSARDVVAATRAGGLYDRVGEEKIRNTLSRTLRIDESNDVRHLCSRLGVDVPTSKSARDALAKMVAEQDARETLRAILAVEQGVGPVEFIPITEFMMRPDVDWCVHGLAQRVGVGHLVAAPGLHKTGLALDLGLSVAYGLDEWMGFPIDRHGHVAYFALEGAAGLPSRIRAWQAGHGLTGEPPRFHPTESLVNLGASYSIDYMRDALAALDEAPALVIIDTQARATRGVDENSAEEMGKIMQTCHRLAQEFGTYVLLVHHTGHDTSRGRGSSDQAASVDLWIQIDPNQFFTVKKVKEAESGAVRYFEVVPEGDSIYVRLIDSHVGAARMHLAQQQKVLTYVRDNPGKTKTAVAKGIKGTYSDNLALIESMIEQGQLHRSGKRIYLATDEAA